MAVTAEDFRVANGQFFSLAPLSTDKENRITAIAVTIEGIIGSEDRRFREERTKYRILASVENLCAGLPITWIASPADAEIKHVNIWPAEEICPFVGIKLPHICWGSSINAWNSAPPGERTLTSFLEVTRQLLSEANLGSRAR
jgi:hypothetical protein